MKKKNYEQPQISSNFLTTHTTILAGSPPSTNVDTGDGPPISDGGGGDPGAFANTAIWYEEGTDTLPTLKFNLWQ